MDEITVLTGCTPGPYTVAAKRLRESCDALGVSIRTAELENTGDWRTNNAMKPKVVLGGLTAFDGPVMWIDADCVLTCPPPNPEYILGDIAFSSMHHGETGEPLEPEPQVFDFGQGRIVQNTKGEYTPWGGWIFFRNKPEVIDLVLTWAKLCHDWGSQCSDEQCLMEALRRHPGVAQGELLFTFGKHFPMGKKHGKPYKDWL